MAEEEGTLVAGYTAEGYVMISRAQSLRVGSEFTSDLQKGQSRVRNKH